MSLKLRTTPITFKELSHAIGFHITCNCHVENALGRCECFELPCYCRELQRLLTEGVIEYFTQEQSGKIIAAFKDMEAHGQKNNLTSVTMLDCADFIHRLNTRKDRFTKFYYDEH